MECKNALFSKKFLIFQGYIYEFDTAYIILIRIPPLRQAEIWRHLSAWILERSIFNIVYRLAYGVR
jgi:hypothetical protein